MARAIVMIGVSAGGLDALRQILARLPADFGLPVVLIQHRSKDSTALCDVLQDSSRLPVAEVIDKAPIVAGTVNLAPPDYHLLVDQGFFALSLDEPQMYSRPSIDIAFESAASAYGDGVIGVVLTGANTDGSLGLRAIVDHGGHGIVQDPATAEAPTMPRAAIAAVPEADVLSLTAIADRLIELQPALEKPRRGRAP